MVYNTEDEVREKYMRFHGLLDTEKRFAFDPVVNLDPYSSSLFQGYQETGMSILRQFPQSALSSLIYKDLDEQYFHFDIVDFFTFMANRSVKYTASSHLQGIPPEKDLLGHVAIYELVNLDKPIRFVRDGDSVPLNVQKLLDNIRKGSDVLSVTYDQLNRYCEKWFIGTVEETIDNLENRQFIKEYNSFYFSHFLKNYLEKVRCVTAGLDFTSLTDEIEQPPSLEDFPSLNPNIPSSGPDRNGSHRGPMPPSKDSLDSNPRNQTQPIPVLDENLTSPKERQPKPSTIR